jgi:DNA-directed RNA polymerase beta' subunit
MAANKNLLKPQNGEPIVNPKMDMVLGAYWMTKTVDGELAKVNIFPVQIPQSPLMITELFLCAQK